MDWLNKLGVGTVITVLSLIGGFTTFAMAQASRLTAVEQGVRAVEQRQNEQYQQLRDDLKEIRSDVRTVRDKVSK